MKRLTVIVITAALLMSVAAGVSAAEPLDLNRKGMLTFVMEWEGEQLDSGSLSVCRVGELADNEGNWSFTLIPELRESGISLEDLEDPELAKEIARQAYETNLPAITEPIREGKSVFADLELGLYLVTQTEACEELAPIHPFLICIPRKVDGVHVYSLTAKPKLSPEPLPTDPTEPPETEPSKPSEPSLPQTGQLNWPVPVMAVSGVALLMLGFYLCFGKKERHES